MTDYPRRPFVIAFRSYPFRSAIPFNFKRIEDYDPAELMISHTRLEIERTHSIGRILRRILEHECVLRREGFNPTTIILGDRLYLELSLAMREYPARRSYGVSIDAAAELDRNKLYGMMVVCDPRVDPQSVYVVPAPEKAALYAEPIRILNLEAARKADAYDAAYPDRLT